MLFTVISRYPISDIIVQHAMVEVGTERNIRRQSPEIDRRFYQNCRVDPLFPFRSKESKGQVRRRSFYFHTDLIHKLMSEIVVRAD